LIQKKGRLFQMAAVKSRFQVAITASAAGDEQWLGRGEGMNSGLEEVKG
jgi:hypothetical protein